MPSPSQIRQAAVEEAPLHDVPAPIEDAAVTVGHADDAHARALQHRLTEVYGTQGEQKLPLAQRIWIIVGATSGLWLLIGAAVFLIAR